MNVVKQYIQAAHNLLKTYCLNVLMLAIFAGMSLSSTAFARVNITVINQDGTNEGFNDPTPVDPVGGNTGTTLGEQRLIALQYSADLIGQMLHSDSDITITAQFNNEGGSAFSATLATAGPNSVHFNFAAAPERDTYYVQALANKLAGADLSSSADINALFNSDVDGDTVLGSDSWYYGLDGSPTSGDIDFVTVSMHELLHGLGFLSLVNLDSGRRFNNRDDIYSYALTHVGASPATFPDMSNSQRATAATATNQLVWNGSATNSESSTLNNGLTNNMAQVYAPNPLENGSSVSHFSSLVSPNELMEPNYTGAKHDLGLAAALLADMGWGNLTDLTLTVQAQSSFGVVDSSSSFDVIASNLGNQTGEDVVVAIEIPTDATLVDATPDQGFCSVANSTLNCDLGDLAAGQQSTVTVAFNFSSGGSHTVAADIYADIVEKEVSNNDDDLSFSVLLGGGEGDGPVAFAGADAAIAIGETAALSAQNSMGTSAPITTYQWRQLSGTNVTLVDADQENASFITPNTTDTLIFELTVTDSDNLTSTDTISLTPNFAPNASAGSDQQVDRGATVTISAASSSDSDGNIASVQWEQISGSHNISINSASSTQTSFSAPNGDDLITLRVTVTDNSGLSDTDTVSITVGDGVSSANSLNASSSGGGGGGSLTWLGVLLLSVSASIRRKFSAHSDT